VYNTRLNNTVNGPVHLGHVYTGLVNKYAAVESEGFFVMRFDDSNPAWLTTLGQERMNAIMEGQQDDLNWLGVSPDGYYRQSDMMDEVHEWIAKKGVTLLPDDPLPYTPEIIGVPEGTILYPLTATLTPEKVVMDWMQGINLLIRGIDLITEYSLYQYYCRVFDLPEPKHVYLPRLRWSKGDMSKSFGSQSVADLRRFGYTPKEVMAMVEKACLLLPANGWKISNLKAQPCL
jgi:glutamyl/glutaminyl-tRNA synthetase